MKEELQKLTETEERIITVISKAAYTIKELSILLKISESSVRNHVGRLSKKGLICDMCLLKNPSTKLYFYNDSVKSL